MTLHVTVVPVQERQELQGQITFSGRRTDTRLEELGITRYTSHQTEVTLGRALLHP